MNRSANRPYKFVAFALSCFLGLIALTSTAHSQAASRGNADNRAGSPRSPQSLAVHALEASDLNAWLDGYIPSALRTGDIAGAVVVVVKDGKVVSARGYGFADIANRRPVDPSRTLFRVGSISKLFTWTAVMQQLEAGKLDLDRDVNAYLDFRIPPRNGRPVTLRQIMTHTAGFELAGKDTLTFNPPIPLDTYLKRWVPKRIFDPGTTPAYSNWATALAGYIVQRTAGMPFEQYVERRIFVPLQMNASSFRQPLPRSLSGRSARGYPRASVAPLGFEVIGPGPAGALSISGTDMAKFMIAHLDGNSRLLSPAVMNLMHDGDPGRLHPTASFPGLNRMALGFVGSDINGRRVIGHGGDTQYFKSLFQLFSNERVGIFASFNSAGRDGMAQAARDQLFVNFADRYFPGAQTEPRVDANTAKQHASMMAGYWLGSARAEGNFLALAGLLGQTKVGTTPEGRLLIASLKDVDGTPHRWQEISPFLWDSESGHERLAAQVSNGRVSRWSTSSMAPISVFDRPPGSRSAAWILPALSLSIGIVLITALYWPAAWLVRRRYKNVSAVEGRALLAYRAVRAACFLSLAVLAGWVTLLASMFTDLSLISVRSDGWLQLLQVSGIVAFIGTFAVAVWNAYLTWRDDRSLPRKLWSLAVVVAASMVLYCTWTFGLMAIGTNY